MSVALAWHFARCSTPSGCIHMRFHAACWLTLLLCLDLAVGLSLSGIKCSSAAAIKCSTPPAVKCSTVPGIKCSSACAIKCRRSPAIKCSTVPAIKCRGVPQTCMHRLRTTQVLPGSNRVTGKFLTAVTVLVQDLCYSDPLSSVLTISDPNQVQDDLSSHCSTQELVHISICLDETELW